MQSSSYTGVTGWKIENGTLYLNSATIQVGALPADPQLITIEASSWPESSFPTGALDQLKFIQGEIEAIPEQWRASAKVSTQDESFGRDGSEIRTTLTYERLETAAEAEARHPKTAKAVKCIALPGGGLELYDESGVLRARFGALPGDEIVARVQADEAAADQVAAAATATPTEALEDLLSRFSSTIKMSRIACSGHGKQRTDEIRKVIADEMRPTGMLYRYHRFSR